MKALIIAAGDGTRMQPVTRGRHKSLMSLLGLKIIERVILGAKEAGVYEFVIVTGYKGKDLRAAVGDGQKYGVKINYVDNPRWEKANGLSVLRAKKYFNENFVLLMSDHVFDPNTLVKLMRLKLKDRECALAIDRKLGSVLDVSDTTKTMINKGKVSAIGKKLEKYNAYDTGMFLCSPYIFEVLEKTTRVGKNSLTNGTSILASEGMLRILDIKYRFWADCDTWADIKFAEKKLLSSLAKQQDGVLSKNFNRKVSAFISKFLIKTSISPNMISYSIPLLGVLTFFMLATGVYPWLIFGGVLIQLMSILDGCDGEIARLRFLRSKFGGFLDANLDKYVDTLAIAGMTLGYLRVTGNQWILPISLFVVFALGLDGYMPMKFKVLSRRRLTFGAPQFINFKRDLRLLVLALGAIFNQLMLSLLILLAIYHLKVVIRLISAKRLTDELGAQQATKKLAKTKPVVVSLIASKKLTEDELMVEAPSEKSLRPFHFES